jgi:hypothetical protein
VLLCSVVAGKWFYRDAEHTAGDRWAWAVANQDPRACLPPPLPSWGSAAVAHNERAAAAVHLRCYMLRRRRSPAGGPEHRRWQHDRPDPTRPSDPPRAGADGVRQQ